MNHRSELLNSVNWNKTILILLLISFLLQFVIIVNQLSRDICRDIWTKNLPFAELGWVERYWFICLVKWYLDIGWGQWVMKRRERWQDRKKQQKWKDKWGEGKGKKSSKRLEEQCWGRSWEKRKREKKVKILKQKNKDIYIYIYIERERWVVGRYDLKDTLKISVSLFKIRWVASLDNCLVSWLVGWFYGMSTFE